MIEFRLDETRSVLLVRPEAALEEADFVGLAEKVDSYIESSGGLRGLIIDAPTFPGWESFGAMVAHFRFVRDHHQRIQKVAIVTDSVLGDVAERLASHFVAAEIKHFPAGDVEAAALWIAD
ncbi:SpoIIAA family protein [Crateriforma spongiae]|uniref:STAS/SEC14 domain-containing protein n=1 Tax=Crateriforma spongiae TaxID=2724528 RepID=UPI0014482B7C|nr:STAS/SEC14 domain-containing protein [Crateriforma spongiae]